MAPSKSESSILLFKKLYAKLISKYFLLSAKGTMPSFTLKKN